MENKNLNWIQKEIKNAFLQLRVTASEAQISKVGSLVITSMSNEKRLFHRIPHLMDMVDSKDPLLTLAILFHDVVYFQVDQGLPAPTSEILNPILHIQDKTASIKKNLGAEENFVFDIFDVHPGDKLNPVLGMNEFLSAYVAFYALKDILSSQALIQVIICIEATIPFRASVAGTDPMSALAKKTKACNTKYSLGLNEEQICHAVQRAVETANRDVKNFASEDPSWFIATTWMLLPERNENLRGSLYTFEDYRSSLEKMDSFFSFLTPSLIFKQYQGYPEKLVYEHQVMTATLNLATGRKYVKIKLVAICFLKALAELTGGDLPISSFLGELPQPGTAGKRMENYLPKVSGDKVGDKVLLRVLEEGLSSPSTFDLQNSPFAAYILAVMGDANLPTITNYALKYGAGEISASEFLSYMPNEVLNEGARACAVVCEDRREKLNSIPNQIRKEALKRSSNALSSKS